METTDKKEVVKAIYFYLASFVGLILIVIGTSQLINLGLKTLIFKQADEIISYPLQRFAPEEIKDLTPEKEEILKQEMIEYEKKERTARKQQTATNAIAIIIVGIPLYLYHWRSIQKNKKNNN